MPPSGRQFALVEGDQRAVAVEVGGGLRTYSVAGHDVIDGYPETEMSSVGRGQQLIPWPNRLSGGRYRWEGHDHQLPLSEPAAGNAIHGLVRWANWTATAHERARVTLRHRLHPQPGYPFTLDLEVTYALDQGGLRVRQRAENVGDTACPFGAGAHPYLSAGAGPIDQASLRAPAARYYLTDSHQIPTATAPVEGTAFDFRTARTIGPTVLDTAFAGLEPDPDGATRIQLAGDHGVVTLWMSGAYRYLMLFTGDSIGEVHRRRHGLGVEPMTCPPNAFATGEGVIHLEPGEVFTGEWGISREGG